MWKDNSGENVEGQQWRECGRTTVEGVSEVRCVGREGGQQGRKST
jgi:hypothetical protein